jgi:hypothetical protein
MFLCISLNILRVEKKLHVTHLKEMRIFLLQ